MTHSATSNSIQADSHEVMVYMQEIAQEVRRFVIENFLFGEDGQFSNDDSFFERGLVDSMGILTLVEFVKQKYGISIEDEEIVPDNWDSVQRIANFIHSKQATTA